VLTALQQSNVYLLSQLNSTASLASRVDELALSVDHMLDNSATNTRMLIAAIASTACPCSTSLPVLAPPLDLDNTTETNIVKCQRIQYYLAVMAHWFRSISNYVATGGFLSATVLRALLADSAAQFGLIAIAEGVGVAVALPEIVIATVIGIIMSAVAIYGAMFLASYLDTFEEENTQKALRYALFAVSNAADGSNVYYTVLYDKIGTVGANIIWQLSYTQWFNEMYGTAPVVNTSAYDGTLCADIGISDCITIYSTVVTFNNGSVSAIVWPEQFSSTSTTLDPTKYCNANVYCLTELNGYSITASRAIHGTLNDVSPVFDITTETFHYISPTAYATLFSFDQLPFSVEICPPLL
jgi:hypothetical protein